MARNFLVLRTCCDKELRQCLEEGPAGVPAHLALQERVLDSKTAPDAPFRSFAAFLGGVVASWTGPEKNG